MKPWFAPKRYGYGSGLPVAWEGWLALALYVAAMIAATALLHGMLRLAAYVAVTTAFAVVCARTTEGGWRWRQGPDR